jgi:hypothetical protein
MKKSINDVFKIVRHTYSEDGKVLVHYNIYKRKRIKDEFLTWEKDLSAAIKYCKDILEEEERINNAKLEALKIGDKEITDEEIFAEIL